jgi:hypothetical protein
VNQWVFAGLWIVMALVVMRVAAHFDRGLFDADEDGTMAFLAVLLVWPMLLAFGVMAVFVIGLHRAFMATLPKPPPVPTAEELAAQREVEEALGFREQA